jgi:hypothetical protein
MTKAQVNRDGTGDLGLDRSLRRSGLRDASPRCHGGYFWSLLNFEVDQK